MVNGYIYINMRQSVLNISLSCQGILINNQHIPRENYFFLNEKLSSSDEEEVKKIVKTIIQKMFWRLYTRSSFLVTE